MISNDLLLLVLASGLVWTAQDQLQRAVTPVASLSMLVAVLLFFAALMAWRARGNRRAAGVGATAVSLGMQAGRFLSDFMSGIDWSVSEYWGFWGSSWPVLFAVNGTLVLILLLPISWVQRRWRDA